ncbi:MAG: S-layer homology domain-containing protein, partial [Evtepia sp.]
AVFQDLKGYEWATESILELNRMGIISGVNAIEFNPQENVTREEFVKMISLAFGIVNPDAVCAFTDVDPEDWYYSSVASAYQYGIVNGNSNGRFGIGEPITREDMAVLLDRLLTRLNIPLSEWVYDLFEDDDMISDYARVAVYRMRSNQFFNGVGENQCAPREFANRASAAKMIYGVYLKTKTD